MSVDRKRARAVAGGTYAPRPRGFTLVELLVVIGIISVLIAILVPVVTRARSRANTVAGLSNLHQIGQAMYGYAAINRGMLPFGLYAFGADHSTWCHLLHRYMGGKGDSQLTIDFSTMSRIFHDPNAKVATTTDRAHYSANPVALPEVLAPSPPNWPRPYRISKVNGDLILIMDAVQEPRFEWGSSANAFGLDNGNWLAKPYLNPADSDLNDPIQPGPNLDADFFPAVGNIRWRQWGDSAANFLFGDGHAATLRKADVRKKNIRPKPNY